MEKLYNIIILVCSIISIVIIVTLQITLSENVKYYLTMVDWSICSLFWFDFIKEFTKAKNKKKYMIKRGIIDLLSSMPLIDALRYLRLLRIIRLGREIYNSNSKIELSPVGSILLAVLIFYSMFFVGAELFYLTEHDLNAHVNNISDALWWAFTTITTVGYGDIVPVTTNGRIVASITMIFGIGVFSISLTWAASIIKGIRNKNKMILTKNGEIILHNHSTGLFLRHKNGNVHLVKVEEHIIDDIEVSVTDLEVLKKKKKTKININKREDTKASQGNKKISATDTNFPDNKHQLDDDDNDDK